MSRYLCFNFNRKKEINFTFFPASIKKRKTTEIHATRPINAGDTRAKNKRHNEEKEKTLLRAGPNIIKNKNSTIYRARE
jgi:hypothetical protein